MTQTHIERLCKTWQRRLRLQDWKVTAQLLPEAEMPPDHWARNDWDEEEMTSLIRIEAGLDDLVTETHLVHELLHLRHCQWEVEYGDKKQESCLSIETDCFMQAYRRCKRKPKVKKDGTNGTTS